MTAPSPQGRSPWRALWRAAQLLIVLAMLAGLVHLAQPARLWSALVATRWGWVALAVPWVFAGALLDAGRLYALIKPQGWQGGMGEMVRTNLVVNFASLFLPGTVGGGLVAWVRLARPDRLHAQTFAALALNTALKLAAVCAVGASALALDPATGGARRSTVALLALCAALPLAGVAALAYTGLASRLRAVHVNRLRRWMPGRVHEAGGKVLESFEIYRSTPRAAIGATLLGLVRVAVGAMTPFFCLLAVDAPVPFVRLLWIMCAVEVAGMMPFTLSGLGLPQVTFVGLAALFGVAADKATASQAVNWAAMLPMLLTGAAILICESLRRGPAGERTRARR